MKETFQKYLKGTKKAAKPAEPRTTAEISAEYAELCAKVGHAEYRIKVLESDLNALFNRIVELDREGFARKKLDEDAATAAKVEENKSGAV